MTKIFNASAPFTRESFSSSSFDTLLSKKAESSENRSIFWFKLYNETKYEKIVVLKNSPSTLLEIKEAIKDFMGFNDYLKPKKHSGCSSDSTCNSSDPSTPSKIPRKIRNARPEDLELAFASEPNTIIEDMTMIVPPDSKFIGRRIYVDNQKMSSPKKTAAFQPRDKFNSVVHFSRKNLRFIPAFVPDSTGLKLKNENINTNFNNFREVTILENEENKNSDVNSDYEQAFNSTEETTDSSNQSAQEEQPKNEFQVNPFGFFRPPPPRYPKKEVSAADYIFKENRSFDKQGKPSKQRGRRMNEQKKAAIDKMLNIHHERSRSRN